MAPEKRGDKGRGVNCYKDIASGLQLICSHLGLDGADYVKSVLSIDFTEPEDKQDFSAMTRYGRKIAAYLCCLYKAGFKVPKGFKVKFSGEQDRNVLARPARTIDTNKRAPLNNASDCIAADWA